LIFASVRCGVVFGQVHQDDRVAARAAGSVGIAGVTAEHQEVHRVLRGLDLRRTVVLGHLIERFDPLHPIFD
jgi:hypothetical protein